MELNDIPAAFQSRLRLAVVAALITGPKDFTSLTKLTEATPGNLGRQMELLESDGFVSCQKEFWGKRSLPLDTAVKLAQYYGVSVDYLDGLTDDPSPYA